MLHMRKSMMKMSYFGLHLGILYLKFADSCIHLVFSLTLSHLSFLSTKKKTNRRAYKLQQQAFSMPNPSNYPKVRTVQ